MDVEGLAVLMVGIFFYLILFPFLSFPNIIFSFLLVRTWWKEPSRKRIRYLSLFFPVAGVLFYLTIDTFEAKNLASLWLLILAFISLLPVYLYFKTRATSKKNY